MKITIGEFNDFLQDKYNEADKAAVNNHNFDSAFYVDWDKFLNYWYDDGSALLPEINKDFVIDTVDIRMVLSEREGEMKVDDEIERWRKLRSVQMYIVEVPKENVAAFDMMLLEFVEKYNEGKEIKLTIY